MVKNKLWTMQVEYEQSKSTIPLYARCVQTAIVQAGKEIASRYVSDKRFAKGKITIHDLDGEVVYQIPEEGSGEAGFVKVKKEK